MSLKVLLFGGTFNPIHYGHLLLAQHVRETLDFDEVVFIPSAIPTLKNINVSFAHRYSMVRLAIGENSFFTLSDVENQIDGPSYTIETVRHIKKLDTFDMFKEYGQDIDPYWLIGPDNLEDLKNWHKVDELVEECSFVLGIWDGDKDIKPFFPRSSLFSKEIPDHCRWFRALPDFKDHPFYEKLDEKMLVVPIPNIEIRSTAIRKKVSEGLSIKYMVPPVVERYIQNYGLYTATEQSKKQALSCQSGGSNS